jgi:hypothetical protein
MDSTCSRCSVLLERALTVLAEEVGFGLGAILDMVVKKI